MSTISQTRVANWLTAVVLVVVPFHAFLTVWLSTFVGHFVLLRLWDELLLLLLAGIVCWWLYHDRELRQSLLHNWLARLIGSYIVLTLITGLVALLLRQVTLPALLYGLTINLRFLVWFLAVWLVASRSDWLHDHWRQFMFMPLSLVVVFGLLQFFVLPHDFLAHFGYSAQTYVPFITINQDSSVLRIQSFLRGANPLGAYLALMIILLGCLVAWRRAAWRYAVLSVATVVTLVVTFSRSSWLAVVAGLAIVAGVRLAVYRRLLILLIAAVVLLLLALGGVAMVGKNQTLQDVFFHVNEQSTATQTSDSQHLSSAEGSAQYILAHPLGDGPGTAGQASWYNTGHPIRNTESYFLELAEEVGWVGFGLFAAILALVGYLLWQRQADPLALGLLASVAGMAIVSIFTYSWADDTLAYVWWGLVGIALARPIRPKH